MGRDLQAVSWDIEVSFPPSPPPYVFFSILSPVWNLVRCLGHDSQPTTFLQAGPRHRKGSNPVTRSL